MRTTGALLAAAIGLFGCAGERGSTEKDSAAARSVAASGPATAASGAVSVDGRAVRVLFVGTSLTAGLGLDPDSAYPAIIERTARAAGVPLLATNAGVSGETSAGALRRIDWALREPADVVVLETGANDGLRALRIDSTRANLRALVRRVKATRPDARIVLVQMLAPPNLGAGYTSRFRAMFPEVARAEGVALAPFLLEGVAGVDSLNQADGIHPNERGERIVAATVWRALQPVVDSVRAASGVGGGAAAGAAPAAGPRGG